jgi:predicted nucleic acid-binding Zn ribbon protein
MESLGVLLPELLRRWKLAEGVAGWRAVEEWPAAVGPRIAQRTRAVEFREGILVVEVQGSVWRHELGFLKRDLLRKIRERAGSCRITDVKFITARGGIQR